MKKKWYERKWYALVMAILGVVTIILIGLYVIAKAVNSDEPVSGLTVQALNLYWVLGIVIGLLTLIFIYEAIR